MAIAVVDQLEPVQVHQQQGHLGAVALTVGDGLADAVQAQQAIGEVGQGIMVGEELDPLLGRLGGGDIGEAGDVLGGLPDAVAHRGDGQPFGEDLAGFAAVPDLPLPLALGQEAVPECLIKLR